MSLSLYQSHVKSWSLRGSLYCLSHLSLIFLLAQTLLLGATPANTSATAPQQRVVAAVEEEKGGKEAYFPPAVPTPLTPAWGILPVSPVHSAKWLLAEKLNQTLYSREKTLLVKDKIKQLLHERTNGNLASVKEQSENIINTGILRIYASEFKKSAIEFNRLYHVFEKGEYLFYIALNSALIDSNRAKIEFSKYLRVARYQKESELWFNLANILADIVNKNTISNKKRYQALVKWFYDQYSFYTCFLMVKLFEKYVPSVQRSEDDWNFIHIMHANLFIKSGNPLDAIAYLDSQLPHSANIAAIISHKLAILYYKTQQYEQAYQTFQKFTPTPANSGSYYYYLALLQLKQDNFTAFKISFAKLKTLAKTEKNQSFTEKLTELLELSLLVKRFEDNSLSYTSTPTSTFPQSQPSPSVPRSPD